MSHARNKVDWCLKKAEKELAEKGQHRGLVKIEPSKDRAREYAKKAEHYIGATLFLKKKFSDISASTSFYSIYHSLLAILAKFGYESRNQECTFAVIYSLIEDNKINIKKSTIDKVNLLNNKKDKETVVEIREQYQYGTELSMKEELYKGTFELAKKILGKAKEIIEQ